MSGWTGSTRASIQRDGGDPIVVGGKTYKKGLGCPERSSVMFMTDRRADRFHAVVGVDAEGEIKKKGGTRGGRFRVLDGDWFSDKVLWDSEDMKPGDDPKEIDIAIGNVESLLLGVQGHGHPRMLGRSARCGG